MGEIGNNNPVNVQCDLWILSSNCTICSEVNEKWHGVYEWKKFEC